MYGYRSVYKKFVLLPNNIYIYRKFYRRILILILLFKENEKCSLIGTFLTKHIDLLLEEVLIFSLDVAHNCPLSSFLAVYFFCCNKKFLQLNTQSLSLSRKLQPWMVNWKKCYNLCLLDVPFGNPLFLSFLEVII